MLMLGMDLGIGGDGLIWEGVGREAQNFGELEAGGVCSLALCWVHP